MHWNINECLWYIKYCLFIYICVCVCVCVVHLLVWIINRHTKYRVSTKSFPDYKYLLQETLRCTSEEFQHWIIFQQYGAPPHWGSDVRRFLDAIFPNRWIGRDGPTPWPPRSPDITPLWLLFMGGMLRTKCFGHQFQILQIWKARITDGFATITEDMLENT